MTTQTVTAQLMLNTGESVALSSTFTDGTESELKTSGVVGTGGGISATSIGTFADGKTITSILQPPASSGGSDGNGFVTYAYIARRGAIVACLPVATLGVYSEPSPMMFRLQAGDTIRCLTAYSAAQKRQVSFNVVTSTGTNAIFSVTPTGAGNNDLTHILSGQSFGESLQGQTVSMHYTTAKEQALSAGSQVFYLNDRGLPKGGCVMVNPDNLQMQANAAGLVAVALNDVARTVTSA
tara:strand:+ start:3126 stop:3839 length:714 start_codon:yes stop_codon:yes gene_type:complete